MKKYLLASAITAFAVAAAFGTTPSFAAYAEDITMVSLQSRRDRLVECHEQMNNITATAAGENRDLTVDERRDYDALDAEFSGLQGDIARFENQLERQNVMNGSAGRQTAPNPAANEPTPQPQARTQAQIDAAARRPSQPAQPKADTRGNWGFQTYGMYLNSVRTASARGGRVDPRLIENAPTTYGQEGVGADGGFAVPPDFRTEILKKVLGEDSLLARTDQMITTTNGITIPLDETTPWQTSGGIQAYWESEGGQKGQSKPSLGGLTVKANKVIALVPVTDELLEDAPSMASYINSRAPEKIDFKVNEAIIKGTGVGQPLGILNSAGTVVVDKESGQAADTVLTENIMGMYYRMHAAGKRRAVWLMNSDSEALLWRLKFVDQGSGNAVPMYMPPGGMSAAPYGTLLGRPVMTSEAMPALGDAGDIIFADMDAYMTVVKSGGIRQDVSIHLFFDYDITAFRFVLRVGGQPRWNSAIARSGGQSSRGFFVALGARG